MSITALEQARARPGRVVAGPRQAGRRLGDLRRDPPRSRRSLVVDHGCDVRVAHARLEPAEVLALLEWLPLAYDDLALVERRGLVDPAAALSLVLRPPTIWTAVDALAVRAHVLDPAGLARHAADRVTAAQIRRLRRAARRIETQLPLPDLRRASTIVTSGCAAVAADEAACAEAAAVQLVRYATSHLIHTL